jgi:hypothetical protein
MNRFPGRTTQPTSDQQRFIFANPFDRRRSHPNVRTLNVNAEHWCKVKKISTVGGDSQPL